MGKIHDRIAGRAASIHRLTSPALQQRRMERATGMTSAQAPAPGKGQKDGLCNRSSCQKPGAYYFNRGSQAHYCLRCAADLNPWSPDDFELFPDLQPDGREPALVHSLWARRQLWIDHRKREGAQAVQVERHAAELYPMPGA